jgi:hypothetical protein
MLVFSAGVAPVGGSLRAGGRACNERRARRAGAGRAVAYDRRLGPGSGCGRKLGDDFFGALFAAGAAVDGLAGDEVGGFAGLGDLDAVVEGCGEGGHLDPDEGDFAALAGVGHDGGLRAAGDLFKDPAFGELLGDGHGGDGVAIAEVQGDTQFTGAAGSEGGDDGLGELESVPALGAGGSRGGFGGDGGRGGSGGSGCGGRGAFAHDGLGVVAADLRAGGAEERFASDGLGGGAAGVVTTKAKTN